MPLSLTMVMGPKDLHVVPNEWHEMACRLMILLDESTLLKRKRKEEKDVGKVLCTIALRVIFPKETISCLGFPRGEPPGRSLRMISVMPSGS